jgi:hypothetical protein
MLTCDRCGAEIEQSVIEVYMRKPSAIVYYSVLFPTSYDLCPKCKDELRRFMRNE